MGKSALTFAEIFIVLSLVFLVQTVANFNLYEGIAETESADWVVLSLRQVPSAGSAADHLRYIRVTGAGVDIGLKFFSVGRSAGPATQGASAPTAPVDFLSPPDVTELTLSVDAQGDCRERPAVDPTVFGRRHNELDRESFLKVLRQVFRVDLSRIEVAGNQPEYVLSWKPDELPPDTVLTLGLEHCFLGSTPASRQIDPAWETGLESLDFPHPLIVHRTEYRRRIIDGAPQVRYVHVDSLPEDLGSLASHETAGLALRGALASCNASGHSRHSIRNLGYMEFHLPLAEGWGL